MPGINKLGTANTSDYTLGRGILYFASVDANGFPKEFRDLGNCPAFNCSTASEVLEHKSSRAGLKVTDKKVVVEKTISVNFTLDEINFDNLALFMSGAATTVYTQAGAALAHSATNGNLKVVGGLGRWYDIYDNAMAATGFAYPPANTAKRVYRISAYSVKNLAGSTTYTEGTDYVMDADLGRIFIPFTSTITANQELSVAYTKAAQAIEQVSGLTVSEITGALKFVQVNAANNSSKYEYQFHAVTIVSSGDLGLISDEMGTMQFEGSVEAREAVDPVAPTCRVRYVGV